MRNKHTEMAKSGLLPIGSVQSQGSFDSCPSEVCKFSGVELIPFLNKKQGLNGLATHLYAQNYYSQSPLATAPHFPLDTHAGNCSQFFLAMLP